MRIDAHQHYWRLARGDYGWLTPELGRIFRDVEPADLAPLIAAQQISATITVQAAPTEAETQFLLGLADRHSNIAGVVGWTDLRADDAALRVASLAGNPLLVGLRPMLQDLPADDWILSPEIDRGIDAMIAHHLVFDALVKPRHLAHLATFAGNFKALTIVIDHAAKPDIAAASLDPWRRDMEQLARHDNVFVKLSGLLTEARPDWTLASLEPYVQHLLSTFGPDRIIWGSDWPVLERAADYSTWCAATDNLLEACSPTARDAIRGGNAERIYLASRGCKPC